MKQRLKEVKEQKTLKYFLGFNRMLRYNNLMRLDIAFV